MSNCLNQKALEFQLFIFVRMYTKQVINDIETNYSRYCESISDQMLFYNTKHFFSYLFSIDIVKDILSNLKKECPYNEETIKEYNTLEGFNLLQLVAQDRKKYVSYVLHFLEYSFASGLIINFYVEAAWICYGEKEYTLKEKIMLFKTEVIKPLCDYVIDELRKNVSLLYVLNRFKNRTMRFETPYPTEYSERDIQNNLALYLFDRGYNVHREEDLSNGKPDFLYSDEDNNPYIIEVKYITKKISENKFREYTSQLNNYVNEQYTSIGVLCIFTTKDYEFSWKNNPTNMEIITIYVGKLKPSKRNTEFISLDFNKLRK